MSDTPQPDKPTDDDVVTSANEGLAEADAARAEVAASNDADATDAEGASAAADDEVQAEDAPVVDPDIAAFEAAEREHPGTFEVTTAGEASAVDAPEEVPVRDEVVSPAYAEVPEPTVTYAPPVGVSGDAETQVVAAEPAVAPAPQPIFVQAPEAPRPLGNRGVAGAIGLLATVVFAALYLGVILALATISGEVNSQNIVDVLLANLATWTFWVPVVTFFLAFWLLGAIINRGRWGKWVIFGFFVAAATYGGYLLGQLFQAPFWRLTPADGVELITNQFFAPLAIAAFVIARELTIWFGAWVARSGARRTELNAEAQREYERTLEAGPSLAAR